jgi:hypothetical protein
MEFQKGYDFSKREMRVAGSIIGFEEWNPVLTKSYYEQDY